MKARAYIPTAIALAFGVGAAQAQGIPVIDAANLVQAIQQVVNDITKINNQIQQIGQLRQQLNSINGSRHLGTVFNRRSTTTFPPRHFASSTQSAHPDMAP